MGFKEFMLQYYIAFFEIIGLFLILIISVHIPKRMKFYTRIALGLLFATIIVENAEHWTQTFETLSMWRFILTATKYSLYPLTILMIIEIFTPDVKIPLKYRIILYIPELICIPIFFTSQWTHLVCYFLEPNNYNGGPLSILPYVLSAIYIAVFLIQNIIHLISYKLRDRLIALYITIGSIAFIVFYLLNDIEITDYASIFVAALVFYYLFTYIHLASIDPLTGLMNRQIYYEDINDNKNNIKAVISIDMNELKYINDTYGHDKGDEALIIISKIILENSGYKRNAYRVGGDEFVMFLSTNDEEEVKNKIKKMKEELEHTPYSCAFGYAMNSNNDLSEAIKESDNYMYYNKNKMKESFLNDGKVLHLR